LDWLGGQVDNGTYNRIDSHTVKIGSVKFRFRLTNHHKTLMLTPLLSKAMIRQAVSHPNQFSAAFWAVTVAYPGHTWNRVPCDRCG
jgi:hypothetical protein